MGTNKSLNQQKATWPAAPFGKGEHEQEGTQQSHPPYNRRRASSHIIEGYNINVIKISDMLGMLLQLVQLSKVKAMASLFIIREFITRQYEVYMG